jgi:3,4-dihydroxy 2-butanone 4-phosphate synthase / GTP cyclohydrolase II
MTQEAFSPMPEVIEAVRQGNIVIVTDDENRENEGDLVCAGSLITPSHINFMATHGRGLICVAMEKQRLAALGIGRMHERGRRDPYNTAFMQSVDARRRITTGISAPDRAHTIRLLVEPTTQPDDLISPGHVFPLEAVPGGVLQRPGHTEAAVELARWAGLEAAGVICEILREDGEMARLPDLMAYADQHDLLMTSVADIVAWKKEHASTMVTA